LQKKSGASLLSLLWLNADAPSAATLSNVLVQDNVYMSKPQVAVGCLSLRLSSPFGFFRRAARLVNANRGFTLIELVITVAIVAILATAAFPIAELTIKRSKEQELRQSLREIRTAIDAYKQAVDEGKITKKPEESGYPKNLEILVTGVDNAKDPNKSKIYFLRRLPRDPMSIDSGIGAAETWGKRSYASPPDEPKEGDDVFDVYSLSEGIGINSIPYREW
jgi:general secretion pathway protein G